MNKKSLILLSAVGAAVLVTGCDRGDADDVAKARQEARDETARIQREADEKIAEVRREADRKIAEAQREADEKKVEATKEATKDVAEERRDLETALQRAKQDTREEYLEYARKKARLLELQTAEAKANANELPAQRAPDFDQKLQAIESRRRTVLDTLKDVDKEDAKDGWDMTKAKIQTELNELEKQVEMID
jgi:hypothetical protein